MKLHTKKAIFLKRYKRFFADVLMDGKKLTCHLPNTGSLKTCLFENSPCWISEATNPKRKLKYTLEFIQTPSGLAGLNTQHPNKLIFESFEKKQIFSSFDSIKKECKVGENTRLDFMLEKGKKRHFVEVKNVSLKEKNIALFPDAVTQRGKKHIESLIKIVEKKDSAEMIFVVQRENCEFFQTADHIDPEYGKLLKKAFKKGVKVSIYPVIFKKDGIYLNNQKKLKWTQFSLSK